MLHTTTLIDSRVYARHDCTGTVHTSQTELRTPTYETIYHQDIAPGHTHICSLLPLQKLWEHTAPNPKPPSSAGNHHSHKFLSPTRVKICLKWRRMHQCNGSTYDGEHSSHKFLMVQLHHITTSMSDPDSTDHKYEFEQDVKVWSPKSDEEKNDIVPLANPGIWSIINDEPNAHMFTGGGCCCCYDQGAHLEPLKGDENYGICSICARENTCQYCDMVNCELMTCTRCQTRICTFCTVPSHHSNFEVFCIACFQEENIQ